MRLRDCLISHCWPFTIQYILETLKICFKSQSVYSLNCAIRWYYLNLRQFSLSCAIWFGFLFNAIKSQAQKRHFLLTNGENALLQNKWNNLLPFLSLSCKYLSLISLRWMLSTHESCTLMNMNHGTTYATQVLQLCIESQSMKAWFRGKLTAWFRAMTQNCRCTPLLHSTRVVTSKCGANYYQIYVIILCYYCRKYILAFSD